MIYQVGKSLLVLSERLLPILYLSSFNRKPAPDQTYQ